MFSSATGNSKSFSSQCQNCYKQVDYGQIKVCGACRSHKYCSVACQKEAWKDHKPVCKANQLLLAQDFKENEASPEALKKWTAVHRESISGACLVSLQIMTPAGRAKLNKQTLFIDLKYNPRGTSDGTMLSLRKASVLSFDQVENMIPGINVAGHRARSVENQKKTGMGDVCVLVLVNCT